MCISWGCDTALACGKSVWVCLVGTHVVGFILVGSLIPRVNPWCCRVCENRVCLIMECACVCGVREWSFLTCNRTVLCFLLFVFLFFCIFSNVCDN